MVNQELQVKVVRRYAPDTPEAMKQRRGRVIAILRKYRAYILPPEDLPEEQQAKLKELLESADG